jgi:hypothetical protein
MLINLLSNNKDNINRIKYYFSISNNHSYMLLIDLRYSFKFLKVK